MGSSMGFEYRYSFEVDDDIVSQYSPYTLGGNVKFLFETRTNFIVRGKVDGDGGDYKEVIIDSEIYAAAGIGAFGVEGYLKCRMAPRLKDYWMSDDEIQELVHKALAFAKRSRPPPNPRRGLISVVVNLDVCTVQQEGEPIDVTMDRAIRTQYLYPMNLCPVNEAAPQKHTPKEHELVHHKLLVFLRNKLHTIRVEDVNESSAVMEVCPICLRNPTIGAQISLLGCGHAFHTYCIVGWLGNKRSCPICRQQAHDEPMKY